MVNVLVDRHHAGLYHSLQLLGARLGWTLYTPHGHEWWDAGIWQFGSVYGDDRLARQYLMCPQEPDNEFPDWPINYVSLEEARTMDWKYVVATVQENQSGFHRFAREVGATYVYQVGNTNQDVSWSLDPLALVSSEVPIIGRGIRYHQEMDPIAFREIVERRTAASFVNCMNSTGCYPLLLEAQAQGLPVSVYGIDGVDGIIKPLPRLLDLMASVGWGWHDKVQGDGFGHVLHSWAAVGRPLIGHSSHYRGRMAEVFWTPETSIDLDRHSVADAVEMVRSMPPEQHEQMCRDIRAVFDSISYDAEAEMIADFLKVPVAA